MLNRDFVERLETMNDPKRLPALLQNTKPSGTVRRVRRFVDARFDLPLKDLADVLEQPGGDRNVTLDPRGMRNDGEDNGGEEVGAQAAALILGPSETLVVVPNEVVQKLPLFGPKEVAGMIGVDDSLALESIVRRRNE